jgi:hypothetical protein
VEWAKSALGAPDDLGNLGDGYGWAIATDGHGNSYVTGQFTGIITFGAGQANETMFQTAISDDPAVYS